MVLEDDLCGIELHRKRGEDGVSKGRRVREDRVSRRIPQSLERGRDLASVSAKSCLGMFSGLC